MKLLSRTAPARVKRFETFCRSEFLGTLSGASEIGSRTCDKNYELLKSNPSHLSLHFKKIGKYRAVRVGLQYRALAIETGEDLLWFWIGTHAEYDRLIG
jgi:hypothetical protein